MQVLLEAIKFNHDPDSATCDAFNIRRNETEFVHVPEWRRGISVRPEDSPAAYARDELAERTPTIKAKFSFLNADPGIERIKIRALDGRLNPKTNSSKGSNSFFPMVRPLIREALDNVLGSVTEREINVQTHEEFEFFNLHESKIQTVGVTATDIVWRWQFSLSPGSWTDFATTTHRIYTVLCMPTLPWHPDSSVSSNTQQPWAEVLDYACRWADSAGNTDDAATLVTHSVSSLGSTLVKYDNPNSGSTGFTFGDSFDCTDFLTLLRGQKNKHGSGVNCDDCAAFVTSFANILGCDLSEAEMGLDIPLNPHQRIGLPGLFKSFFSHHTVAWKGACGEDDELFDACVKLDSDAEPAVSPHPLFVPARIPFGRMHEHLYRFRLASDENRCIPTPGSARRRRIAPIALSGDGATLEAIMTFLENRDATQNDKARVALDFLLSNLFGRKNELLPWRLLDYRFIADPDSLFSVQSFWSHNSEANAELRIDSYASSRAKDVNSKLKQILSRFELLDIVQQEYADFGDEVHAVPTNFAIVFARGKFIFQLRNIGHRFVSCEGFARFIDHLLISQLKTEVDQVSDSTKRIGE